MMPPRLIAIDWGTTGFRAWLVDTASGAVLDEVPEGPGMRGLKTAEFPTACARVVDPWRDSSEAPPPPVYMAGMVGAPQGWRKAPQLPLPLTAADLADQVVRAEGVADAWIIPGARRQDSPKAVDVMRGEEVQIFGALSLSGAAGGLFCLPGTHSKWARVEDGALVRFDTAMTGEVHQVMLDHSILGLTADRDAAFSEAAFDLGLEQTEQPGGVLHHLFTARARGLFGDLTPPGAASYVSGVLVGTEIRDMTTLYPGAAEVALVCADRLRVPYARALARAGLAARFTPARDASLAGILAVVRRHRAGDRVTGA